MAYDVKQIHALVNDAVTDALGQNSAIKTLETTDIISLGKTLANMQSLEGWFGALANRIVKTVYFVRTYEANTRNILRDENEYGAYIQKVYYELPEAVENPTWEIPTNEGAYAQASPYDVETSIAVSSLIFGGKGTWTIEIVRPIEQIKTAFLSESNMMSFIDGIYLVVENAFKLEEERLIATAANTAMATCIRSSNAAQKRNLYAEWNTAHSDNAFTSVSEALESADFLKFASKEINKTIKNMSQMSTVYNADGYTTHTPTDMLVVEMLNEFASCTDMYLQADTFHNELTALPNYTTVPFWQTSGKSYAFADCSKIKVKHTDLISESIVGDDGTVEQGGIICFIHDIENVAAYFGSRRSWEVVNPRSEVVIHGEKADKGFAIDSHANAVVFYLA